MNTNKENEKLLAAVQELMDDLDLPDWLQKKTNTVLKAKKETMTDHVLYRYLKQLGQSEKTMLPIELVNEEWLQSVYDSHSKWVETEITFLEETTYESFNTHLEKSPNSIKDMSTKAQRSYIAVSCSLLNVFAQIDDVFHQEETVNIIEKKLMKRTEFYIFLK